MHIECAQDTWYIGLCPEIPAFTPNNQCIEKWHKNIMEELQGELRASTEACLNRSLPKLFWNDGINKPDSLLFEVQHIPKAVVLKALTYVDNTSSMIKGWQKKVGDSAATMKTLTCGYVLRHKAYWDKIDALLIEMCISMHSRAF